MRVGDLIQGLPIRLAERPGGGAGSAAEARICDVTEDSRTVLPGSLFIARRGEQADGRRFIKDALRAGAAAILTDDEGAETALGLITGASRGERSKNEVPCAALLAAADVELAAAQVAERFYGNPSRDLVVIGVTGTNGKTTVTWLIHQLLNACGVRCGLVGTVYVDDGSELAQATLTTPPAIELSRTLGLMRDAGCRAAVLEVSSHALEQNRVAALAFDAAIFTNLSGDHLDYHETMSGYAAAKARLFAMLPEAGLAIVNVDDEAAGTMLEAARGRVIRCSLRQQAGAEAGATIEGLSIQGTDAAYRGPWGELRAWTGLIGRHNVMNMLQAIVAVHGACEVETERVQTALSHVSPPPGRLEPMTRRDAPLSIFVDYAHSDASLETVLRTLRELLPGISKRKDGARGEARGATAGGRLCVVFGCGGDRDRTKRPRMGRVAAAHADRIFITSDNPRREDPMSIISEVRAGIPKGSEAEVVIEADRARAIRRAIASSAPGDVVLIAGKGHEDYQIVPDGMGGTVRRHLDDREEARAALVKRGITPLPDPLARAAPAAAEQEESDAVETLDMDWVDETNGAETEQV